MQIVNLRPYQIDLQNSIYDSWRRGAKNTLGVLPTGGGKTVVFSNIILNNDGPSCVIAHRQELVGQISLALARNNVRHTIIGPRSVIKLAVSLHMEDLKRSLFDPSARVAVAGVRTLIRRTDHDTMRWAESVSLWVLDECHHALTKNEWGAAIRMFPNARGLGVTATPLRADGNGLGRGYDGVFDEIIDGPGMRELITAGFLTDYRIFAPLSDMDLTGVNVSSSTGDYSPPKLKAAVRKSHIIGDVIEHYQRIAPGKLGITFATDVETATDIAGRFNAAGVPAEIVSAKTPDAERIHILRRFRNRELLQLVNVDLFGEGFDVSAIEVISMARPTQSFGLYCQQFGRSLRPLPGKTYALIIDHVGNVMRHGLPDAPQQWTLARREKRGGSRDLGSDAIRVCGACAGVYERFRGMECPYCGHIMPQGSRSSPEQVDGDLTELDAATLARMRGDIDRIDMDPEIYRAELQEKHATWIAEMTHVKRHARTQDAQRVLRESIAWWAGIRRATGSSDAESYREFYRCFRVDVMTAQALKADPALELADRVSNESGAAMGVN